MPTSMKLLGHLTIKICVWASVYILPKVGLPRELRLSQVSLMEQKLEGSKTGCRKDGSGGHYCSEVIMGLGQKLEWGGISYVLYYSCHESKIRS